MHRCRCRYIGWGKTTQLGYGLGLAMGAKLARPEKLCMNVWGDAAIGLTGMEQISLAADACAHGCIPRGCLRVSVIDQRNSFGG